MIERIPVYLLTGFLGSGKTTLLARWLDEAPLRDAALIVNELGAVGLDHATLGYAGDASALIADACVCCSGLPGLHEALENLFWARLHRSITRFASVVVETTGLADPGPLIASLASATFISERYRLAGVVTTIGAPTALQTLDTFSEARAQLEAAHLIIVTKTDLIDLATLLRTLDALRRIYPAKRIRSAAHGDLGSADALHELHAAEASLHEPPPAAWQPPANSRIGSGFSKRGSAGRHAALTRFEPIDGTHSIDALHAQLDALIAVHRNALLRMKGIVKMRDGSSVVVQYTHGGHHASLSGAPEVLKKVASGVTLILRNAPAPALEQAR
jgi:G3E family GTPase